MSILIRGLVPKLDPMGNIESLKIPALVKILRSLGVAFEGSMRSHSLF